MCNGFMEFKISSTMNSRTGIILGVWNLRIRVRSETPAAILPGLDVCTYPIHGTFNYEPMESDAWLGPEYRLPPLGDSIKCSFIVIYQAGSANLAIRINNTNPQQTLKIHYFYRLVDQVNDEQSFEFKGTVTITGPKIIGRRSIEDFQVTDDFFKNGCLKIDYGIYLERTKVVDEVWRFNFWNGIYDYMNSKNMIIWVLRNQQRLYSHKQLVSHHSPLFSTVPFGWNVTFENYSSDSIYLERCLQIGHGVRLEYGANDLEEILKIAENLKMYSVSHYCQYQLMAMEKYENLKFSFSLNLRHLLQFQLLRKLKKSPTKEDFKNSIMDLDFQQMTGESMKLCTRFIFNHF
ncbi:unnamed protein product [Caenorhabditis nigoni]